ncbi:hypothetical protein HPB52_017559 [Rhipicephalus sanguineus]|uniref:Uncharacterized protein n=1 Tax=Rhipicephalus sanguineus TaxID=34632 RepID=A0A9D4PT56_RHISA|nr:hypothetical protein HPB52_017559 [Rhipicephalus sanguineus]
MRRGSGSEDESVQGNPQVVVAPESQGNERFGELTPERRLEELRAEMEKLSQVISGSARDSELGSGRQDRCGSRWKIKADGSEIDIVYKGEIAREPDVSEKVCIGNT